MRERSSKKKRRALSQSFPSLLLPTSLLPPISLAIAQHRSKRASCSPPNDWRRRKRPREVQSCGRRRDPPRRSDEKTDDFKVVILNRSLTLLSRRLPMGVGAPLFPSVGVPPFWLPWPRRPPGTGMGDEAAAMVFGSFFPLFFRAGNRTEASVEIEEREQRARVVPSLLRSDVLRFRAGEKASPRKARERERAGSKRRGATVRKRERACCGKKGGGGDWTWKECRRRGGLE